MFRRSLFACGFAALVVSALPTGAAAPVPKHLMPKEPAFTHPTAVGTTWVYNYRGVEYTQTLTAVELKGTAWVLTLESLTADGRRKPDHKLRIDSRGLSMIEQDGYAYEPAWPLMRFPLGREHKWDYEIARDNLGSLRIVGSSMQEGKSERVKVPAGEFDAWRVVSEWGFSDRQNARRSPSWYAPGIGLVRVGDPPFMLLKSFTPGKG